jgi:AcrR family transcriptional regulator
MSREDNKADKRARIRDAAAALFRERGFEATTTQAVAERAGVAKGTVFLYAPSKPALVVLVFEERIARIADEAFASLDPGAPLGAQLEHVLGRFFVAYAEDPELARIFVRELMFPDGMVEERRRAVDGAFLARLAALVEAHRGRGLREDVSPMLAASNAFALYLLALMAWLAGVLPGPDAARAQLHASIELMIEGLAAPRKEDVLWSTRERSKKGSRSGTRGSGTSTRGASGTVATKPRGSRSAR